VNLIALAHAVAADVPLAAVLGGGTLLAVFFPQVAALIGRWLIGTERGRIVLLASVVGLLWWHDHQARFSDGVTRGVAIEHAKTQAAQVKAAMGAAADFLAMTDEFARIEGDYAQRSQVAVKQAVDRAVAGVRAGRLREPWRCDLQAAAHPGEPAGCAERRAAATGRVAGIGAAADTRLAECVALLQAERGLK
jgi:hypothetical protein